MLFTMDTCRALLTFRHTQATETHVRLDPGYGGNLVFEDMIFFSTDVKSAPSPFQFECGGEKDALYEVLFSPDRVN